MSKRISSRAVIVKDNKLVVLFRRKNKDGVVREYYSLPGGGLEEGETLEENVKREVNEEFGVKINVLGYVGMVEDEKTIQHYFHAEIIDGVPKLGGEELERLSDDNYYEVSYLDIDKLDSYDLYNTDLIKKAINHEYIERK